MRRCDFVGVGMALLEKRATVGQTLRVSMLKRLPRVSADFLLQDVGLLAVSPVPHLPASHHAPCPDDNGLNL